MRNIFRLLFISLLLLALVSCSDDNDNIRFYIAESYNADGTPNRVSAETKNTAYDWYIDTKYDNKESRYLITKLELLLKEKSTGPVYIDLVEDLTDTYKNKYPEIGVKSIYAVMKTLYRYNPIDI